MNEKSDFPEARDPLEQLLADAHRPIPDAGFTARVILVLPARGTLLGLRPVLFAAAWLGGAVIVALHSHELLGVTADVLAQAGRGNSAMLLACVPVAVALGSLVWGLISLACEEH